MPIFAPDDPPPTGILIRTLVVRFHRDQAGADRFEAMPNVRCDAVHYQQGCTLPTAQFSYVFDDNDEAFPTRFEALWPYGVPASPYAVRDNDELLVYELWPDGTRRLVFDGFATIPQIDHGTGSVLSFVAVNVGVRLWDRVVGGAEYRDNQHADDGEPVVTGLPTHFNPHGKPNKSRVDHHVGEDDQRGVFLDVEARWKVDGETVGPTFWTLPDLVHYLCWRYNADEEYVRNPRPPGDGTLDDYLVSVSPKDGEFMDLLDPLTYDTAPIVVRGFDATGQPWPVAMAEQLGYHGFEVFFNTYEDPDDEGAPYNEIVVFRTDGRDMNAPVELYYPADGTPIVGNVPDMAGFSLARDHFEPFNTVEVETAPIEAEVSVVLAEGFSISASDASAVSGFDLSALASASADLRKRYRFFTADEDGSGHWNRTSASFTTDAPLNLDDVFGGPDPEGARQYVCRFRKADNTVHAVDSEGDERKAELAISTDYAGPAPALWDRSGNWRSLGHSGWRLDEKGLGIWLTVDNPESWKVPKGSDVAAPGDVVRVVSSLAGADTTKRFRLRLTTRIKGDLGARAVAAKREAVPSPWSITRRVDGRDQWVKHIVHKSSAYNTTGSTFVLRDDGQKAQAHADSLRLAHEFPVIAGAVKCHSICHWIGVGDAISRINGRDVDLATNNGSSFGEGPRYPYVVGVSHSYQGRQETVLKISDRRAEPEHVERGRG